MMKYWHFMITRQSVQSLQTKSSVAQKTCAAGFKVLWLCVSLTTTQTSIPTLGIICEIVQKIWDSHFWGFDPVTLTLKTAAQSFCLTHCLMVIHWFTKFGRKVFSSSEWTNIQRRFKHTVTLSSIQIFCSILVHGRRSKIPRLVAKD